MCDIEISRGESGPRKLTPIQVGSNNTVFTQLLAILQSIQPRNAFFAPSGYILAAAIFCRTLFNFCSLFVLLRLIPLDRLSCSVKNILAALIDFGTSVICISDPVQALRFHASKCDQLKQFLSPESNSISFARLLTPSLKCGVV